MKLKENSGQGLIEYLILVALMSIATISVIRVLNQNVRAKFTNVIYGLQSSSQRAKTESVTEDLYKKKDFRNFLNGSSSNENNEP